MHFASFRQIQQLPVWEHSLTLPFHRHPLVPTTEVHTTAPNSRVTLRNTLRKARRGSDGSKRRTSKCLGALSERFPTGPGMMVALQLGKEAMAHIFDSHIDSVKM